MSDRDWSIFPLFWEFTGLSPRLALSPLRAMVKKVRSQGLHYFPLGVAFQLRHYHWAMPVLHHNWVATTSVPGESLWFWLWPGPAGLASWLGHGPVSSLWTCWVITGLSLTMTTASGPDLDPDLLLYILAPCWWSHCSCLPYSCAPFLPHLCLWSSWPLLVPDTRLPSVLSKTLWCLLHQREFWWWKIYYIQFKHETYLCFSSYVQIK